MNEQQYDIFISYKRKSLATANNLYYRLTTRGYSTFFDLEEMRRNNFDTQLLSYIEHSKDVFIILEEGSLDACKDENWGEDWFCREIAHALKTGKNIIPILIDGYKMPQADFLPEELKGLTLKNAPEFSFAYFEEYLDKLIEKEYIISEAHANVKSTSIFKFYSDNDYQVFRDGKLVCCVEGGADEPYYLPVSRKGDYRFKCIDTTTEEAIIIKEHIESNEEKEINIDQNNKKETKKNKLKVIGMGFTVLIVAFVLVFSIFGTIGFCVGYFSNIMNVEEAMNNAFREQRITTINPHTIRYSGETLKFEYDIQSERIDIEKLGFEIFDQITFERVMMSISIPLAFERLLTSTRSIGNSKAKAAALVGGSIGIICGYSIGEPIGEGWAVKKNEDALEDYFKKKSTKDMIQQKLNDLYD